MKFKSNIKAVVALGSRVYLVHSWKRRDAIYYDNELIGYIHLSLEDRMGFTVSIRNQLKQQGRAISWCVQQSHLNMHRPLYKQKRTLDVKSKRTTCTGNVHV